MVVFFFFFQAEDGIRDLTVTGVQTCALPISVVESRQPINSAGRGCETKPAGPAGRFPNASAGRRGWLTGNEGPCPEHRSSAPSHQDRCVWMSLITAYANHQRRGEFGDSGRAKDRNQFSYATETIANRSSSAQLSFNNSRRRASKRRAPASLQRMPA